MHPEGEAYPIQGGCAHVAWPGPGPEGRARTHTRSCPGERGFALEQDFWGRHGFFFHMSKNSSVVRNLFLSTTKRAQVI